MQNTRKGKAYIFGDNINTDIISPPQYMELSVEEAAKYAMSAVDVNFASTVEPGDIIVAGNNFGSGSSRELAPLSLRHLKVGAIVAKSFARIFYRNALNLGLPVVECAAVDEIAQGDEIFIDFVAGILKNVTRDKTYPCGKLPPHILVLVQDGGLINHLKKQRGMA